MNRLPTSLPTARLLARRPSSLRPAAPSAASARFSDPRWPPPQTQRQFRSASVIRPATDKDDRGRGRGGGGFGRGVEIERDGGRGGRGFDGGRKQPSQRQRPDVDAESPPLINKGPIKSITVAKEKGAATYCYGCGATMVKKSEQEIQTIQAVEETKGGPAKISAGLVNQDGKSFQGIRMGLKSSAGGYWKQKKKDVEISKIKNWGYCPRCKALQNDVKKDREPGDSHLEALSPSHEMTQIFREQVSRIRDRNDAVVVLCVDAVNPQGSLIKKLRNYVGGNPILLAVTRCDLLPEYVTQSWSPQRKERIKNFFRSQAKELHPADVYLCSVNDDEDRDGYGFGFDGSETLADDLLEYLDGRDPYVVGAANIGKSTLTDRLIDNVIAAHAGPSMERFREQRHRQNRNMSEKERKRQRFRKPSDREMNFSRYAAVQQSRVTKSSLPGTTLQNVRVPCFQDHTQALWDTPGLLLDPSLSHYPIRDYRRIKAQRPRRIEPQWHIVDRKSFALLVLENPSNSKVDNDEAKGEVYGAHEEGEDKEEMLPLLRIEIRLKKKKQARDLEPVHLVWNSTLNDILATDVVSIDESHAAEKMRTDAKDEARRKEMEWAEQQGLLMPTNETEKEEATEEDDKEGATEEGGEESETIESTLEERARIKEEKCRRHEAWKEAQIAEMGKWRWNLLQKEKRHRFNRLRLWGSALVMVMEVEIPAGAAREINVENFGSLGVVSPSTDTLVRVFAPNSGIRPACHPPMVVPPRWERHVRDDGLGVDDVRQEKMGAMDEFERQMESNWSSYDEEDYDTGWGGMGMDEDDGDDWGRGGRCGRGSSRSKHDGGLTHRQRYNLRREMKKKRWTQFSGEKIGWKFHEKPHYTKGIFVDGWQKMHEDEKEGN